MINKAIKKGLVVKMILLLFLGYSPVLAQSSPQVISLDSCYAWAKQNYPLVKQKMLLQKSEEFSLENANKGFLPKINIVGQATYQSEVTSLPISLPNLEIPELSNDQYRIYGEAQQPITDLFTVKDQKAIVKNNTVVEEQKIEVELYKLRERINQLYFGILLIDAQLQQIDILKKDIDLGIEKTKVAVSNGIALQSNTDLLVAELLQSDQKEIELRALKQGYADMLSLFINREITDDVQLEKPAPVLPTNDISRPELSLFSYQQKAIDLQSKLITNNTLPKFSLFVQGGYGRPALNLLSNDFEAYYIGGIRLNWNLSSFYTLRKDKQLLTITQNTLDIQKKVFLFNTELNIQQQNSEISKLEKLIASDDEIIELRKGIKEATQTQLELGTATTADYMNYLNAEDQAKQNQLMHEIQLLMAQYHLNTTTGN